MCLLTPLEHFQLLLVVIIDGRFLVLLLILLASLHELLQVVDHFAVVVFVLLLVGLLWYNLILLRCSIMDFDFLQRRCKLIIVVQPGYSSLMVRLLPLR